MILPPDHDLRRIAKWLLAAALGVVLCPATYGASNNKPEKDKPEKTKKEKVEIWTEVRTSHFIVVSDGGEGTSRRIADQFEQVRDVFRTVMPNAHFDTGIPIRILAAKDGQGFAKLLPEFPADKRQAQPPGLFVQGPEKNYIVVRTNSVIPGISHSGTDPYQQIYEDYARLILKLSYRNLPPWLEEGYLSASGSLVINGKEARFDRPDPDDLSVLYESPLLPIDVVLHADRDSPYYDAGGDRQTVYFAESHALVHYMLTDPQMLQQKPLDQYIELVEGGADSLDAARKAFGNLAQLQSNLAAYIKQMTQTPAIPSGTGNVISSKTLTPAEAEARIADFDLSRRRIDDAQAKLEDALKLEPSMADAEESLGFVMLQQTQLDDADKHFARALELDPNSALAYYGQALVAMDRGGEVGIPLDAIAPFEKTVALNPDFAPAWGDLASIYARQPETMQKALVAAQHATALAPGDGGYQYTLAKIMEDLGQQGNARQIAAQPRNSPDDSRIANKPAGILARGSEAASSSTPAPQNGTQEASAPDAPSSTSTTSSPASASTATSAQVSPTDQPLQIERKTDPADDKPAPASVTPRSSEPPPILPPQPPAPRTYSMLGTISEVNCSGAPQMLLTLKAFTIVMHLHAANFTHLAIKPEGAASAKSPSCAALRGHNARVTYQLSSGQSWDGEITSIELRSEP